METLIQLIRRVEEDVFQKAVYCLQHKEQFKAFPSIWVHQLTGDVRVGGSSLGQGYVSNYVTLLCDYSQKTRYPVSRKLIRKWIEGEVLLHSS